VRAVIAKSLARIHRANLVNFGILPLILEDKADYAQLEQGCTVTLDTTLLAPGAVVQVTVGGGAAVAVRNDLTAKELDIIRAGGLLNYVRLSKTAAA
jgi:aconitate hydratase